MTEMELVPAEMFRGMSETANICENLTLIIVLLWRPLADRGRRSVRLRAERNLWRFDVKYASTTGVKYAAYSCERRDHAARNHRYRY